LIQKYFRYLPSYAAHAFRLLDLILGGITLVIILLLAKVLGAQPQTLGLITVAVVSLVVWESGYRAYREEREVRAERESNIRVEAKLSSIAVNVPDPGPDKVSLRAEVYWEMWVDRVVTLNEMGLNVIYVYDKPRWKFWKNTRFPKTGIPRKGQDTTQFRLTIDEMMGRPYHDIATFEYVADKEASAEPHWLLEFVIKTGMPIGNYRVAIAPPTREELLLRGTHPPL